MEKVSFMPDYETSIKLRQKHKKSADISIIINQGDTA